MSRPALDTLAAQLSASLSEMSAALRRKLSESRESSEINEAPDLGEAPRVESPFRKPAIPVEKPLESDTPVSRNGVLDAVIAAFRRLVGAAPPAPQTLSGRPVKRFRTARHRVRKH